MEKSWCRLPICLRIYIPKGVVFGPAFSVFLDGSARLGSISSFHYKLKSCFVFFFQKDLHAFMKPQKWPYIYLSLNDWQSNRTKGF